MDPIKKRGNIKAKLTRFVEYTTKLQDNFNNDVNYSLTDAEICQLRTRLDNIEPLLQQFEEVQCEVESTSVDLESEYKQSLEFENRYFEFRSVAQTILSKVESRSLRGGPALSHVSSRDNRTASEASNSPSREDVSVSNASSASGVASNLVRLPPINLPTFSGNFGDWLNFKDMFNDLIHTNSTLSDVSKLHYLKTSLTGKAAELIKNLSLCSNNYAVAWENLNERFSNNKILVHNHIKALFNLEPVTKESPSKLLRLVDVLKQNLRSFDNLVKVENQKDALLIYLVSSKLDLNSVREFEDKYNSDKVPTIEDLIRFIEKRASFLETIETRNSKVTDRSTHHSRSESRSFVASAASCPFCNSNHTMNICDKFKSLSINDRINKARELKLCMNCLSKGHFLKFCKSRFRCFHCRSKHHSLLHTDRSSNSSQPISDSNVPSTPPIIETSAPTLLAHSRGVLLATALIDVRDFQGNLHRARAVLDAGSMSSFVTSSFCDRLGLNRTPVDWKILGVANSSVDINTRCLLEIQSRVSNYRFKLSCLTLNEITGNLPVTFIDTAEWNIPDNLALADPTFSEPGEVDILIGGQYFWHLLDNDRITLGSGKPIVQSTRLGWIVAGPISSPPPVEHCYFSRTDEAIQEQLAKFWELDQDKLGPALSVEESECEKHFIENTVREEDGRFKVKIPFKADPSLLGDSYKVAEKSLFAMEKRLSRDDVLRDRYNSFMQEYEALGHMTLVTSDDSRVSYYLPHHGVLKLSSSTTKLRVVFNASSQSSSGVSLNSLQMVGPTIQRDLVSILLTFRKHVYAFSTDIEKMYRQVLVHEEQRSLQRVLWRSCEDEPVKIYNLNTVTYGTSSASFLAIRCLYQLGIDCRDEFPDVSTIIHDSFYVDDGLGGADIVVAASKICDDLYKVLQSGGFHLRKWISNEPKILSNLPKTDVICSDSVQLGDNECTKTLGLSWNPGNDSLTFSILFTDTSIVTKRSLLSDVSRIFDPLGLLMPCIITAKIMLQQLWLERLSWDDPIPVPLSDQWKHLRDHLPQLNQVNISRRVICDAPVVIELHGFCDASNKAYGGCLYVRSIDSIGNISCHLLCSKSKVSPLKTVSIPRLELCGAIVLSRLFKQVLASFPVSFTNRFLWTDSTIVLGWLRTQPNKLKTFVANRTSEIQNSTQGAEWNHVDGKSNPADLLSRGVAPSDLLSSDLWFHGPSWLGQESSSWPHSSKTLDSLPEMKEDSRTLAVFEPTSDLFAKYSSLNRLKRVVAFCIRFRENCAKSLSERKFGPLTTSELESALTRLIKISQSESFSDELNILHSPDPRRRSKYASLNPFLDSHGIVRVGGRISNSSYSFNKRHPILLCGRHPLAKMITESEHLRLLHGGPQLLLASLRERYWITSGRNLARKIVHSCVKCFRASPKITSPIMGDLPNSRVERTYPFCTTGVDYAGPFLIRNRHGRKSINIKGYICLFICFATKAIHLELVTDLSTNAFILALRRFVARRGVPSHIYSDNGTNFLGARSVLLELGKFLKNNSNEISEASSARGIQWHFIPSHSPHFGGLWEAGVKSSKHHLKRVIGASVLTFEEFYTLLTQIEATLNSRPLTQLSAEPDDLEPLTPGHFLVGRAPTSLPDPDLQHLPMQRLTRFQLLQQLFQSFWKQWSLQYVGELQQRTKWREHCSEIQLNSLVLIKEDHLPPLRWKLGRIVALHPGKDGISRVATIRTQSGTTKRSFSKICPLPVESS